jgi:hypothetical protein
MPWAKGIMIKNDFINMVKCRVCFFIENKEKSWVVSGTL